MKKLIAALILSSAFAWNTQAQTGALFFLVAFGAIVRWRVSLVREFRRLGAQPG